MFHNVKQLFIRNSVILILAAAFIAAAGSFAFAETDFSGSGSGTEEDPYLISSLNELQEVSSAVKDGNNFSGQFICLACDIDLPENWEPLGALKEGTSGADEGRNINPFSGTFDGGGHTVRSADGGYALFGFVRNAVIRNLYIEGNNINGNGLIRNYVVDKGPSGSVPVHTADIKNVTIKSGTSIKGSGFVSGYASAGNTVDIVNCTVEEGVTIGCSRDRDKIGSFGGDFNGTVTFCSSAATVYGVDFVGGIIGCKGGSMCDVVISGCTFSGEVHSSGKYAGGIAGGGYGGTVWGYNTAPNALPVSIDNCICTGTVEAMETAGGILGFETTAQPWNEGYVQNNLFTGHVSISEGDSIGGITGAYRGIDRCDIIRGNYYRSGCGADRGIGKVSYVDTSCEDHETEVGENYYSSESQETIPVFEGLNDKFPGNLKVGFYRSDDPLGADAAALARMAADTELADGSLVDALNGAEWSKGCWRQGENAPYIDIEPVITGISIKDGYKDTYYIDEPLDPSVLTFKVRWSDGREDEEISGDTEGLTIAGFDSSKQAFITLTASYKSVVTTFQVRILKESAEDIVVSLTLLGDSMHGRTDETIVHTKTRGNLEEWIPKKNYIMNENDTVYDLIVHALEEKGMSLYTTYSPNYGSDYISGVQMPGTDIFLMEKDNGPYSGWMYSVDGKEPGLSTGMVFLPDGGEVVLFYTDDYTLEKSSHSSGEIEDRLKAEDVADLIKALPAAADAKLSDRAEAEHAQNEFEKLTEAQKGYISDYLKDKLRDVRKKITELEKKVVYKGKTYKVNGSKYKVTLKAASGKRGRVLVVKMKKARKSKVPAYVKLQDGKKYNVTAIGKKAFTSYTTSALIGSNISKMQKYAFRGSRVKTVFLKTKKLKRAAVKGCLKGSKVKMVRVSLGKKGLNKKYRTRYRKIFTKKITGRKVTVR